MRATRPSLAAWLAATRPQFLSVTLLAAGLGIATAAADGTSVSLAAAALTFAGVLLMHAGANLINDFHDRDADAMNFQHLAHFSGGSRMIQNGTFSAATIAAYGYLLMAAVAGVGAVLAWRHCPEVLLVGAAGLALGVCYSAPPVRLSGRGLGELAVAAAWLLITVGADVVQRGTWSAAPWAAGVSLALLLAAVLLVNEFPDHDADRRARKATLVVVLGPFAARWLYCALIGVAYGWLLTMTLVGALPAGASLGLLALPLSLAAARNLCLHAGRSSASALLPGVKATLFAAHLHAIGLIAGLVFPG